MATDRDNKLVNALVRDKGAKPPPDLAWLGANRIDEYEKLPYDLVVGALEAAQVVSLVDSISLRRTAEDLLRHRLAVLRAAVEEI